MIAFVLIILFNSCANSVPASITAPASTSSQASPPSASRLPAPASTPESSFTPSPSTPTIPVISPPSTFGVEAQVLRVIDGDTIEVTLNGQSYKVRYIGMDTPETVDPNRPVQPFGPEASAKNKELVDSRVVRLEKDVSETDRYGRLLRYVYVGDLFINAELVRLGYAQVATYPPDVKYQDLFLQLQREAREANRGLWGLSSAPSTQSPSPAPLLSSSELTLQISSVTSPVSLGANATLIAQTTPGAECSITVYYKSGPSFASGLNAKTADSDGKVSWTWKVGTSTTAGSWRIVVNATSGGKTTTQETYFTVR